MALYLISYDINESDAFEYKPLWHKLGTMGAQRILYSEWVVPSDANNATAIYDQIAPLIQVKDRLLVQEIANNAAWDKLIMSNETFKALCTKYARVRGMGRSGSFAFHFPLL
jgi:CRISPR/Cas system-associated endoribonuclease Cas2